MAKQRKVYSESEWNDLKQGQQSKNTDSYMIEYSIREKKKTIRKEVRYYTNSKNAHLSISKRFKEDFPHAKLIRQIYE